MPGFFSLVSNEINYIIYRLTEKNGLESKQMRFNAHFTNEKVNTLQTKSRKPIETYRYGAGSLAIY